MSYEPKTYRDRGGDRFTVDDGGVLRVLGGGLLEIYGTNVAVRQGTVYYVDAENGDDDNDGLSWDNALATIQEAIDKSNATIDWDATPKAYNEIWVAPGVYAENLTPAFYCIIRGMGMRGTDTAAEIHPATGSCFTGTFLGSGLSNLRLEVDEASKPILDLDIANNSRIQSCEFGIGASVAGVAAIDTENATHLVIMDCDFTSGMNQNMAYVGYHRGGDDKYAHNVQYIGNRMWVKTAGIYVAADCTASQMLIQRNFIFVSGTGTGIHDLNGNSMVVDNDIIVEGAGDAINHAGGAGYTLRNHTLVNGTYALETASA